MENDITKNNGNQGQGPKDFIDIEGKEYPWSQETITTEDIIRIGGLNPADGVIEINLEDQTEVTLKPQQVITVKPGHGFSKKVKFKRG